MVVTTHGSPQCEAAFGVLWGKSKAGDSVNLLLQHLLDTAAVAELLWDRFLAPGIKNKIDKCCGGGGRSLFALVCGLHDVGKASPSFQAKVPSLASAVQEAGLGWRELNLQSRAWHHTLAGAVILRRMDRWAGWSPESVSWVWPLIAGHHGVIRGPGELLSPPQGVTPKGVVSGQSSRTGHVRRLLSVGSHSPPCGRPGAALRRQRPAASSGSSGAAGVVGSGAVVAGEGEVPVTRLGSGAT